MKTWTVLCFATALLASAMSSPQAVAQEKRQLAETEKEVTPVVAPAEEPVSVSGVWEGMPPDDGLKTRFGSAAIQFRLRQDGNSVIGEYDIWQSTGKPMSKVRVEGTITGNRLYLKIPSFAYGYIDATVTDGRIEGTYSGRSAFVQELRVRRKGP